VTNIDVEERSENRKEKGDGTHTQSEHTAALTSIDIEEEITISRVDMAGTSMYIGLTILLMGQH
jgi:hypothetical protein